MRKDREKVLKRVAGLGKGRPMIGESEGDVFQSSSSVGDDMAEEEVASSDDEDDEVSL